MTQDYKQKALCELHVHLEGCIRPDHYRKCWEKSEFFFPPPRLEKTSRSPFNVFLEHIRFGYNFLNTPEAYASVVNDYCRNAIENNICYAEIQINLALILSKKFSLESILTRINGSIQKLQIKPTIRYIIDLPWQFPPRLFFEIMRSVDVYKSLGVVGISLGGDEHFTNVNVLNSFIDVFECARDNGLKRLCHAGETNNYVNAKMIVEKLSPDRVAHAVTISDWIVELGKESYPIDVCLNSNLQLNVINKIEDHPLNEWISRGVPFTLSTDDPAIFQTSLYEEYNQAALFFSRFPEYLNNIHKHMLACSFDADAMQNAIKTWNIHPD